MSTSNEEMQELSNFFKETLEKMVEDYHPSFCELLDELGLSEAEDTVPLKLWSALAQPFADASGYWIGLQAAVLEPVEGDPTTCKIVGHREVASAEPTLFMKSEGE